MALNIGIHVKHTVRPIDEPVVGPLMIPLDVVILRVGIFTRLMLGSRAYSR